MDNSPSPAPPQPGEGDPKKRALSNLVLRGISAIAVIGILYLGLHWDVVHGYGWAWAGIIAVFSVLGLREFYRFATNCDMSPFIWLGYIAGPVFVFAQEWGLSGASKRYLTFDPAFGVMLLFTVGAMLLQLTRKTNANALIDVSVTIFGFIYCAVLPAMSQHLRHLAFPGVGAEGWPMHGVEFTIVCIFVAKVADVGALLTGSRWGKRKLIPRLSPGKTWEGALGGLLFSVFLLQFMALTNPHMALHRVGYAWMALLSLLLAIGGLGGDLIESAFKRNSRRKDAGRGVPGFGGILDLTDSLMVAQPLMYFFLVLFGAEYVQS